MANLSNPRAHRPNDALGRANAPRGNSDPVAELARSLGLADFGRRETRNLAVSPDRHAEHPSRDAHTRPSQPSERHAAALNFDVRSYRAHAGDRSDAYRADAHAQPDGDDHGIYEHDESGIEREETDVGPTHAPRRGRLITIMAVVALAVIGTAGTFAYRGMFTASGPVPSKVGPAIQTNEQQANKRIQNRIAGSQPDAQASAVVNEPKKVRTAVIRQDQADPSGRPVAAANPPAQGAPAGAGGSYVQVSSQRSETAAQAAFKTLQGKHPKVLGDKQAVIRRAELGDKGVYYRTMVGPFASAGQAAELCSSLKAAGGQCIVQRN